MKQRNRTASIAGAVQYKCVSMHRRALRLLCIVVTINR